MVHFLTGTTLVSFFIFFHWLGNTRSTSYTRGWMYLGAVFFFCCGRFVVLLPFKQRHLLKLSNADRADDAAGSALSQPSVFEVVDVLCSLLLV